MKAALAEFLGNQVPYADVTWGMILGALAVLLLSYLLRKYIVEWMLHGLGMVAAKTKTKADDIFIEAIRGPLRFTVVYFGILLAIWILPLERYPRVESVVFHLFRIGGIIIFAWAAVRSTAVITYLLQSLAIKTESLLDDRLIPFFEDVLVILIWIIAGIMVLQDIGYDPSGIIAGLGLGGLAFALAARDTLANFFGSLMLITDKPFKIGDWIQTDDADGNVEEIGFRSTKIRLFDKSVVQVPNSRLANQPIRNFARRDRRRIYFHIGVTYDTTPLQMRAGLNAIRQLILNNERIRHDFYLVNFKEFSDSSLNIMVYCFTTTTVWAEYLEIYEELLLGIMEEFDKLGIEFAFPTMTVHLSPDEPGEIDREAQLLVEKLGGKTIKDTRRPFEESPQIPEDDG